MRAVAVHRALEAEVAAAPALAAATAPGGAVSVLVANRYAAVLVRALGGRLAQARRVLDDPEGRCGASDPLLRRFDTDGLIALLTASGLSV